MKTLKKTKIIKIVIGLLIILLILAISYFATKNNSNSQNSGTVNQYAATGALSGASSAVKQYCTAYRLENYQKNCRHAWEFGYASKKSQIDDDDRRTMQGCNTRFSSATQPLQLRDCKAGFSAAGSSNSGSGSGGSSSSGSSSSGSGGSSSSGSSSSGGSSASDGVQTVNCHGLSGESRTVCDGSLDACDNIDNAKGKACRKGYRAAYNDPNKKMADICKSYSGENKKACETGVRTGRDAKKESEKDVSLGNGTTKGKCGSGKNAVNTMIDLGCLGDDYKGPGGAIGDMAFALVRFLTYGVGIVITISIIASGIQYATSEGNPETTMAAKGRIQASIVSLIVYVFIFSIVQFLVPGGLFN